MTSVADRVAAKARGGFYTPEPLARFLTEWAIRSGDDRVLEPSAGDGAFVRTALDRLEGLGGSASSIVAVELDAREAALVRLTAPDANVIVSDFFDLDVAGLSPVDAVVGNPPFIRYQNFGGTSRGKALGRARSQGVVLTELASSWAHFIVHAAGFLKPTGRLAVVVPSEILHTDYAKPVREYLVSRFQAISVIAFDRLVFPDAQVDAVLLLASNDDAAGLRVLRVADQYALGDVPAQLASLHTADATSRWSGALDAAGLATYHELMASNRVSALGTFARVDIGFVSGANDFFLVSDSEARERRLPLDVLIRALRRPGDVPGLQVGDRDSHWLMRPVGGLEDQSPAVLAYLSEGRSRGISERYKCRVRTPWFRVPLPRQMPDAFIPYMSYRAPRLIVNDVRAWSSNLLHGVTFHEGAPSVAALAVAMTSSATLLSAEIEGRSYGGGVLKLETKEAERLLVPRLGAASNRRLAAAFTDVSQMVAQGEIEAAASVADGLLGFDHPSLWHAYLAFSSRRLGRKRVA